MTLLIIIVVAGVLLLALLTLLMMGLARASRDHRPDDWPND